MAELRALTGIRGLLALAVLLFHLGLCPAGWLAVDGFFVLSGLVLAHVYGAMTHSIGAFFWARFARLAPTCLTATTIIVAIGEVQGLHFAPLDVLSTLLVAPLIVHSSHVNVAMWSLAVECLLYLAFPLLLVVLPHGVIARRIGLAVCAAGSTSLVALTLHYHAIGIIVGPLALMRGLFPFVAGMLICRGGWLRATYSNRLSSLLLDSLDSRPIRFLGEISLPFYLLQVVALRTELPIIGKIALTLALATAMHYVVELPARRWLRAVHYAPAG
ncbi:MAG TPA: acyltransferase family protein [Stellaceae bacterium]|nr:acyltransferase family protein [Stellaceae bacterium]